MLVVPADARADWGVTAFLGNVWTRSNVVHVVIPEARTDLQIEPVQYGDESFRSPVYYGGRVSWTPPAVRHIAVEAEFIHMKMLAEVDRSARVHGLWRGVILDEVMPVGTVVQRLAMSHGLNFILANVAYRSSAHQRLVATVRTGVGATVPHVETTFDGFSHDHYAGGGLGAQAAGGVEAGLRSHVYAVAEYKFTWASPTIAAASGTATVPARSHHLVGGVAYRF